jgi:ribosomal protein S18 acetylase RimI-like enzyme
MTTDQAPASRSLRLRLLTLADLPFADSVRALAGWNQTHADWERFLATEPDGCFLAESNGSSAGTATTTVYGPELAWIGMVLVHPDYRRRGIGGALLRRCIDYLRARGVHCIKLDATPAGRQVYEDLGFRDEWTLARWAGQPALRKPLTSDPKLRPWRKTDAPLVEALDRTAFGVSRQRLLSALGQQSTSSMVLETARGHIAGFGFARPGSQALYVGPVVAESAEAGIGLVETLLSRSDGQTVFWDIPDQNEPATAWARQHGFGIQRPLTRMFLGDNASPGDPLQQFAIASPEVG